MDTNKPDLPLAGEPRPSSPQDEVEEWQQKYHELIAQEDSDAQEIREAFGIKPDGRSLKEQLLAAAPLRSEEPVHKDCHDIVCNSSRKLPRGVKGDGCSCTYRDGLRSEEPSRELAWKLFNESVYQSIEGAVAGEIIELMLRFAALASRSSSEPKLEEIRRLAESCADIAVCAEIVKLCRASDEVRTAGEQEEKSK